MMLCFDVADKRLDTVVFEEVQPQALFRRESIVGPFHLDHRQRTAFVIPNGQVGEPTSRVAVVLYQAAEHSR